MTETFEAIDQQIQKAAAAYQFLKKTTVKERALLMHAVADGIDAMDEAVIQIAHEETNLPLARLKGELARTSGQWRSYASAVAQGIYTDARIDLPQPNVPKNDLRKYHIGIGPVVVFGASNFPFAFSTAGGDTASAIGAGCPVVVKAHPGHPKTSQNMAALMDKVIAEFGWPEGVFTHVTGTSYEIGAFLTSHPLVAAVAFTGSYAGGKALFDLANQRPVPIPVFAEMGSVNPVFALSHQISSDPEALAQAYAASVTLGVGQFCTNPGIFIAQSSEGLSRFKAALVQSIAAIAPASMLNQSIYENFESRRDAICGQEHVSVVSEGNSDRVTGQGRAIIIETTDEHFLQNPALSEEVFGPLGLLVTCQSKETMLAIARQLSGQLTITLSATEQDLNDNESLIAILQDKCGRLLFNGMPTGVEVVYGMQHGGPFPATTDSRFTSVGPDAVKRFLRPLSFQNWPNAYLPDELKNENPLGIVRLVDGQFHSRSIA
jgi:alpha-ketoglutaric semialdehyde dehydrogenase